MKMSIKNLYKRRGVTPKLIMNATMRGSFPAMVIFIPVFFPLAWRQKVMIEHPSRMFITTRCRKNVTVSNT